MRSWVDAGEVGGAAEGPEQRPGGDRASVEATRRLGGAWAQQPRGKGQPERPARP